MIHVRVVQVSALRIATVSYTKPSAMKAHTLVWASCYEGEKDMSKWVDVVIAVVEREDGMVLLSSRPEGKVYAHYWEFPGGKIESGESVQRALVREMQEELGILVDEVRPWYVMRQHYEHADVRLHVCRAKWVAGRIESREGQQWSWERPEAIRVSPCLPNVPRICARLQQRQRL